MSVDDEKKRPRKAPAKKAVAAPKEAAAAKKVKAEAAPKTAAAPKKKAAAKAGNGVASPEAVAQVNPARTPPTYAQIAERAHGYFVARGHQHGFHEEDWFRAERELLTDIDM